MTHTDENSTRVLLVEDDPWIRSLLTDLLPTEGYFVEEATNGPSALRLAKEHRPNVVLLDLAMPEMSGVDVLRELRQDRATENLPVIVVSAYTAQLALSGPLRADAVIQKPIDLGDLLSQIGRVT